MADIKKGRGRPQGSLNGHRMTQRVTIRLPEQEYWYLAGQADSRDRDSLARVIRKAIRFYIHYGAGKRLPVNSEILGETISHTNQTAIESPPAPAPEPAPVIQSYDAGKFVMGGLCKRAHVWPGTEGQTLYRLPNMVCPQCDAVRAKVYRAKRKGTQ